MSARWRIAWLFVAAILVLGIGWLTGCGGNDSGSNKPLSLTGSCTGCHESAEMLQATAIPGETSNEEDTGEG